MMKKLTVLIAAVAAIASLAVATAGSAAGAGTGKASAADQQWITESMQTDLFEIKGGELGQKQGQSKMVVKLGETLARDHSEAYARNKKKAAAIGATVPGQPTATMRKELQVIGAAKGSAFDETFVKAQIKGHLKAIAGAKKEIADGQDATIVAAAKQGLKMYEMHLAMAKKAQQGL
jgi:putative membrane protein